MSEPILPPIYLVIDTSYVVTKPRRQIYFYIRQWNDRDNERDKREQKNKNKIKWNEIKSTQYQVPGTKYPTRIVEIVYRGNGQIGATVRIKQYH